MNPSQRPEFSPTIIETGGILLGLGGSSEAYDPGVIPFLFEFSEAFTQGIKLGGFGTLEQFILEVEDVSLNGASLNRDAMRFQGLNDLVSFQTSNPIR